MDGPGPMDGALVAFSFLEFGSIANRARRLSVCFTIVQLSIGMVTIPEVLFLA
jgi:hypothetical protein